MRAGQIALLCLFLVLCGCGTATTLVGDDVAVSRFLTEEKSYCGSVPRVYSGVIFDLCILNAPPDSSVTVAEGFVAFPLLLIDLLVSAVADTLALPYTIYRQSRDGSIELN